MTSFFFLFSAVFPVFTSSSSKKKHQKKHRVGDGVGVGATMLGRMEGGVVPGPSPPSRMALHGSVET